ncbi:MAG: hypothetical protein K2M95_01490 [Clostridiales bacterium]|nr:hypothetical protein [Clostridiales bacterium]
MLEKVAKIIGKMNSTVILAVGLGIVAVVFIVGLILSLGGDLAKFKSAAKLAISKPTPATLNESAKKMPIYVRKLYKKAKQTGEKPSDVIGINACVNEPFAASTAAKFPGAVMAAGILSILFTFFAAYYVKDIVKVGAFIYVAPLLVTVGVMVFRLLAGLISMCLKKSAAGVYNKYVDMLDKHMHGAQGGHVQEAEEPVVQAAAIEAEEPAVVVAQEEEEETPVTPVTPVRNFSSFDEPDSIAVELADEEPHVEPVVEPQTVVMQPAGESEEEIRAKARAEALAAARAEAAARAAQAAAADQEKARAEAAARAAQAAAADQEKARAEAAARAQAAAQAAARAQAAQNAQAATAGAGSSSADEVIALIDKISREGAPLSTMKEAALQLQKERAKPENKTPETQRKLNEALATLLKAMSGANKK